MNSLLPHSDGDACPADAGGAHANAALSQVVADMVRWLERAVIGLNLCPFAKAVHSKQQIRYQVCCAHQPQEVLQELRRELAHLAEADPEKTDTTLLVLTQGFDDFLYFNDFLEDVDACLIEQGLSDSIQIASFHPDYFFADAPSDDVSNCTNRAPYPCLHLLRESSVDRAVAAFSQAEEIYQRNIDTLRRLGWSGWQALALTATPTK